MRRSALAAGFGLWGMIGLIVVFQNCGGSFRDLPEPLLQVPGGQESPALEESLEEASLNAPQAADAATGAPLLCHLSGSDPNQTALRVQNCLDSVATGGTVFLPPGVHRVSRVITIRKRLRLMTQGVPSGSGPCGLNADRRCAQLQAVSPVAGISVGFFVIKADGVTVDHVVIDGNRQERRSGAEAASCVNWKTAVGYNIEATRLKSLVLNGMTSMNAVCGTGAEISGPNLTMTKSSFINNGVHNVEGLWADGATIHDSSDAKISGNFFQDNTDVDLIFGGCQRCAITENRIVHTNLFAGSSFAGLMLHSWPNNATSGDYTGSKISGNTVDCGNFRCGFGLMIGSEPWYQATMKGGLFFGNSVRGAQLGILINSATNPTQPVQIGPNAVTRSGGSFLASSGMRTAPAAGMSDRSLTAVKFVQGASADSYEIVDFTHSTLNWWSRDSAPKGEPVPTPTPVPTPPICSSATQPFPHWGVKNGQCLRSCGALGGTTSFADACSKHGFVDAGLAYDVPACCKVNPRRICNPVTQPSPHWGVKNGQCLKSCGALGGTVALGQVCSSRKMIDVGIAYDTPFCCKPSPSLHENTSSGGRNR